MKGVTKAAKVANGRSRKCASCPIHKRYRICSPEIQRVCHDAFIEGFKKGVKAAETAIKQKIPKLENEYSSDSTTFRLYIFCQMWHTFPRLL